MNRSTDELLSRPEVDDVVRRVLRRRRLPGDWMEEAVQEVKTRALEASRHDRPDTVERWKGLCYRIANAYGADAIRRQSSSRKVVVGFIAEADDAPLPPGPGGDDAIDVRRRLGVLRELHLAGRVHEKTPEILDAVQAGVPGPVIAEELGVSYRALRRHLATMRARLGANLLQRGLAVGFVVWCVVCARSARVFDRAAVFDGPRRSRPEELTGGDTREGEEDVVREREARDLAERLVMKAEVDLRQRRWFQCVRDIEDAMALDASLGTDATGIRSYCVEQEERSREDNESKARR
jgi:hypothetical protein